MLTVGRPARTFSNPSPRRRTQPDATHLPVKKSIPPAKHTSATKSIDPSIATNGSKTNDWKAIAAQTNSQPRTPDGIFEPTKQKMYWTDGWFLACLEAVANDSDGRKKLVESITKDTIQGISGYFVIFAGFPKAKIFVSKNELGKCLEADGGDADTRLLELAADRIFSVRGKFRSLCLAYYLKTGQDQQEAENSFQEFCSDNEIKNPMTYNPMRSGGRVELGFFLLAGIDSERFKSGFFTLKSTVLKFLHKHLTQDRDGASIVIHGRKNPIGHDYYAERRLAAWDAMRTDIFSDGRVNRQERAFLKALKKWLTTNKNIGALYKAADDLKLEHVNPTTFVNELWNESFSHTVDFHKLADGVQDLLSGGTGYLGIAAEYAGTLRGIDEYYDTFSYTNSKYPDMVFTGNLSDLIAALLAKSTNLSVAEPKTGRSRTVEPKEVYRNEQELPEQLKFSKPDGKFGPARQRAIWTNSWLLSCLAAVAKDYNGRKILAQSIKKALVEGVSGYHVVFAGLPDNKIFISDEILENCQDTFGGDADTRLIELAADRYFMDRGNFKSLCIAYFLKTGQNRKQAEKTFQQFCRDNSIKDPMNYNPMYGGLHTELGFFLLSGNDSKYMNGSFFTTRSTIMQFLQKYLYKNSDGAAVVLEGLDNPWMDKGRYARDLVVGWDAVRTDILSDGTVDSSEVTLLQLMDRWLQTNETRDFKNLKAICATMNLQHVKLDKFLANLAYARTDMGRRSVNMLRNAVRGLIHGGTGYIGFAGGHAGIIHGINRAKNTFTYTEPYFPTMVHTGDLSDLITAINNKHASLRAYDSGYDDFDVEDPNEEL